MTVRQTTTSQTKSAPYEVGYGKPPRHTQFRKGQSGNPGGRPQRVESASELLLREAHRAITVKMGGRAVTLPAIQAIVRSQIRLAAEGNVQAQRAVLTAVQTIEREKKKKEEEDAWDEAFEAAWGSRREAERRAAAQAAREAEAGLAAERAAPAPDKMSDAGAARRTRELLGRDKPKDTSETSKVVSCNVETGAQGKQTATAERESGQQRDAAPVPPADSVREPENEAASAYPPTVPQPSADLPAAPLPWRSPPPRPDRYARHAAREATLSPGASPCADFRTRFRVLRDARPIDHRTGSSERSDMTRDMTWAMTWRKDHTPARRAAKTAGKIRRFPVKFPVLRECRGAAVQTKQPAARGAWRMGARVRVFSAPPRGMGDGGT